MKRIAGLVGAPAAALVMIACASTTEKGTVGIERSQFLLVSSAEMDQSAAAAYQQVIQEQTPKGNVNKDPKQVERVRAIAARIIPQTAVFRKDAPGWKWEVNVLTSPEVNAWCMPGGKIAFYTGILEKLRADGRRDRGRDGPRDRRTRCASTDASEASQQLATRSGRARSASCSGSGRRAPIWPAWSGR